MKKVYVLFILGWGVLLSGCVSLTPSSTKEVDGITCTSTGDTCAFDDTQDVSYNNREQELLLSLFEFKEKEYDFGIIKQSAGSVVHTFTFTYHGDQPLKITGVPTSCACTSADIDKTTLKKGDVATVTVKFNPNLHQEPEGKFFKTITLLTDPKIEERPELKIWANIDLDLGKDAYELKADHDEEGDDETKDLESYNVISPSTLERMLKKKDFVLIDVHIPEQEHITGTDLVIPYNDLETFEDKLPQDKHTKIVLYCRSGSMSRAFAYQLVEHGYTNVYDLMGGKNAYDTYLKNKKQQ